VADVVQKIRSQIGWLGTERIEPVEAGHVRRFAQAIGDDDPRWQEFVPPTFTVTMLFEPPEFPAALEYGAGWLNAGDHFEYLEPVRIGDVLRSRARLSDAFEKQGSTGKLLFLIFETEFRNQHDRVAVRHTGTRLRR
jgi:hypothetical protein